VQVVRVKAKVWILVNGVAYHHPETSYLIELELELELYYAKWQRTKHDT